MSILQGISLAALFIASVRSEPGQVRGDDLPKETAGVVAVAGPAPTPAPDFHPDLLKRAKADTCGFVDGIKSLSVWCDTGYECSFSNDAFGCCATRRECNPWTECLPYLSSEDLSTVNRGETQYCSDPLLPSCVLYEYADPDHTGFTMVACDSIATTYQLYASAFEVDSTTTESSSIESTTTIDSSTTSTSVEPTEPTGPVDPGPEPKKSVPVAPIVGGVVGGVGGIAIISALVFFLFRRKKTPSAQVQLHPTTFDPNAAMAGGYGGEQGHDYRASLAKPPMTMATTGASPTSPAAMATASPQSQNQQYFFTSSPPLSPPPFYNGPEQHQQQWAGTGQSAPAAELPTTPYERPARELEG